MRGRLDKYGFVLGLLMGVAIGVFTGSIALWLGIGVVLGIAISRARFRHKLPPDKVEIIPPSRSMRTR